MLRVTTHPTSHFTDFETSLIQSMENPSVFKKLGVYFVPVEDHNELKGLLDHMALAFGRGIESLPSSKLQFMNL